MSNRTEHHERWEKVIGSTHNCPEVELSIRAQELLLGADRSTVMVTNKPATGECLLSAMLGAVDDGSLRDRAEELLIDFLGPCACRAVSTEGCVNPRFAEGHIIVNALKDGLARDPDERVVQILLHP